MHVLRVDRSLSTHHLYGMAFERTSTDCRIATRAFGVGLLPLVSERYDLAIRKESSPGSIR